MAPTVDIQRTEPQGPVWLSGRTTHIGAILLWLLSLVLFRQPLSDLVNLALHDDHSSHILLVPLISASLLYLRRKRIFHAGRRHTAIGVPLCLIGIACWYIFRGRLTLNPTDQLSVSAFLIFLTWSGIFVLCYGTQTLKNASFPFLFLLLMIPIPVAAVSRAISFLQAGSAETSFALFRLIGVPVARDGFRFSLPGVDIEVAEQCSGIRSALSLFITGLLVAYVFLQSTWKRTLLVLCTVPIAIFKNAVRIVMISWLGVYVNRDFFDGWLHHRGGSLFALLAFALMLLVLRLLSSPRLARGAASNSSRVLGAE